MIQKIISGGQTGADRTALDWAIWHDIPHGGWCPKGRKAEDGPIGSKYLLKETPTSNFPQRTEWNVRDSDGTVIFSLAPALTGGSKKTAAFAIKHKKPWLHIYRDGQYDAAELLLRFISDHRIKILNVAGPRASKEPQIAAFVKKVLEEAFFPQQDSGSAVRARDNDVNRTQEQVRRFSSRQTPRRSYRTFRLVVTSCIR